jgi:hypothetical protein
MRSIHMENRLLPSDRRPATLSIRPHRSLCVDRMEMGRVRSASWRRWQRGRVTGCKSEGQALAAPGARAARRGGRPDGILEVSPIQRATGPRQGVAPSNRSGPRGWSVRSRIPLVERPGGYPECVPRPRRDLTTTEKRHLHSLEGRISRLEAELQATRREWAELVEEAGQAAVARELGVSRQAIADRLRRIRANREGRSGRR